MKRWISSCLTTPCEIFLLSFSFVFVRDIVYSLFGRNDYILFLFTCLGVEFPRVRAFTW